jgi:hypothetical protein
MTGVVYALCDPRDGAVRYIGKSEERRCAAWSKDVGRVLRHKSPRSSRPSVHS